MLSKHSRLSRELFLATFKKARRVQGVGFQLLYTPFPTFQASVVVSKKNIPKAVGRNYMRRRFYAFLYAYEKKTGARGRFIIILSAEHKKHSLETVLLSLEETLSRALSPKQYSR